MNTSSLVIGIILLLIFIAPISYIILKQAGQDKKHKKQLKAFFDKHQYTPSQTAYLSEISIGLDENSKKLAVLIFDKIQQDLLVDLNSIKSSVVLKKFGDKEVQERSLDSVEEISLNLSGTTVAFNRKIIFYDGNIHSVSEIETRLIFAEKWNRIIQTVLDNK